MALADNFAVTDCGAPFHDALVRTTYAHPGVGRTTELIQRKFHWPTYKRDVRDYVL